MVLAHLGVFNLGGLIVIQRKMASVVLFRELFHVFLMLSLICFFLRLSIALEKHLLI